MKPRQPVQQQGANSDSTTWKMRDRINRQLLTPSCRILWQEGVLFFGAAIVVWLCDETKNVLYRFDAAGSDPPRSLSL